MYFCGKTQEKQRKHFINKGASQRRTGRWLRRRGDKANRNGEIEGECGSNLRITARHDPKTGKTTLRVDIYDENAETPARIRAALEKEGYKIDTDGASSGFVEFDNYWDAKKFAEHVDEVQKQVDKEETEKDNFNQFKEDSPEARRGIRLHHRRQIKVVKTKANESSHPQQSASAAHISATIDKVAQQTGGVHLYMPNIHDSYTAEKTIWHAQGYDYSSSSTRSKHILRSEYGHTAVEVRTYFDRRTCSTTKGSAFQTPNQCVQTILLPLT